MTVRTAYVGTQSSGDVLTAANFTKVPGGWIGYAAVTANQTSIGTGQTDLTSVTVTVTAGTTRRLRITGKGQFVQGATAALTELRLIEDGTQIDAADIVLAGASGRQGIVMSVRTPSAGSHTYKLAALSDAGTSTLSASATVPCFILVEDIGPAS